MANISFSEFSKGKPVKVVGTNQDLLEPTTPEQATKPNFFQRLASDFTKRGQDITTGIQKQADDIQQHADMSLKGEFQAAGDLGQAALRTVGGVAGGVADIFKEALSPIIGGIADKISDSPTVQRLAQEGNAGGNLLDNVQFGADKFKEFATKHPEAAKDLANSFDIAALLAGEKPVNTAGDAVVDTAKGIANDVSAIQSKIPQTRMPSTVDLGTKITDFLSRDPDPKTATILKETPTAKFDSYVKIAEEASKDPRKLTPFEVVGEEAQKAAVQLDKRIKGLAGQKNSIINKAKVGLEDFSSDVGKTILDIQRAKIKDPVVSKVVGILKGAKTKLEADKAIDSIQEILYKGNKDMTLPSGSATDVKLKGILGDLNGRLKAALPENYGSINDELSGLIKNRNYLNKILGEKINGISVRGGSVAKRFFSPSDAGTKELFDFLKQSLGIDLAQDATLARFTMELFDDARARSLLEGVPTSPSGVVNKIVDFAAEKTGVAKGAQEAFKKSEARKARALTK